MRGILSTAGYVPHHRLNRSAIADTLGGAPAKGTRAVASYDEDTTTMGVEAARAALAAAPEAAPAQLLFASAEPAYQDKTNATAIWAALRLDRGVAAIDMCGSVRSAIGALRIALDANATTLVVSSGMRGGRPTSADESQGGDAAAAILVGDGTAAEVVAEYLGAGSATDEFVDRWREPGAAYSKTWEERFAETRYGPLVERAFEDAVKAAGITPAEVKRVVVTGTHARAIRRVPRALGIDTDALVDDLTFEVGNTGAAHAALVLTSAIENAEADQVVAVVSVSDGADVLVFRTTEALTTRTAARRVATQIATGDDSLGYGKFLKWRGTLDVEPPNRPEPARPSASAAARREDWKFGFTGSRDRATGALHLPPQRASWKGDAIDDMAPAPMSQARATIRSFTVDRLAYSPSPPIVFAVLDFDASGNNPHGRMPCELTDVAAADVEVGDRVEMTFRRLFTADGLHNYFWKARPVREGEED